MRENEYDSNVVDTPVHAARDALVGAAEELGPLIRENAERGERDRRLPAATAKGLTEAGLFRQAQLRIAATHATTASAGAVDRMYTAAGGSALFAASPLQPCLRDVHAITQHAFVAAPTYVPLGKILVGVEPDGFLL